MFHGLFLKCCNFMKIVIYGPNFVKPKGSYGSGVGGYVRNMKTYNYLYKKSTNSTMNIFHTVRGQNYGFKEFFIIRLFSDIIHFSIKILEFNPYAIHILAQYRTAMYREFFIVLLCNISHIKVIYDIKAGAFINSYKNKNFIYKLFTYYVIKSSCVVLCEGKPVKYFLMKEFNKPSFYFPNFVLLNEIPNSVPQIFNKPCIHFLFVGFCYKSKGVFELVDSCNELAFSGFHVQLSIVGAEHPSFVKFLNEKKLSPNFTLHRYGKKSHEFALNMFNKADIYVYPTRHPGEGHNNTINEALMYGRIIVTTRWGFLNSILSSNSCFFIDDITKQNLLESFKLILTNKEEARTVALNGRSLLELNFTEKYASQVLKKTHNYLKIC